MKTIIWMCHQLLTVIILSFLFLILHILLLSNSWCMFGTYCYLERREGGREWCLPGIPMASTVSTSGGKAVLKGVHFRTGPSRLLVVGRSIRDAEPVAAPWQSRQNAHVTTASFICMSISVTVLMQTINSTLWANEHISWGFLCKPLCWGFPVASHREGGEKTFVKDIQDKLFSFCFRLQSSLFAHLNDIIAAQIHVQHFCTLQNWRLKWLK